MTLDQIRALVEELAGPQVRSALSWLYYNLIGPMLAPTGLHWLWISCAVVFAYGFFRLTVGAGPRTERSFISWLVPREVFLHASARLDYRFYVVNQLVLMHLRLGSLVTAIVGFLFAADATKALLTALLGASQGQATPSIAILIVFTLLTLMANDFGRYLAHYLQHKVPSLWEFHKVHHAAEVLTPITGYRSHAIDQMLDMGLRLVMAGFIGGVFGYFYPGGLAELTILSFNAVAALIYYPVVLLQHSHVRLGYGPILSRMLISPLMHQVHHSLEKPHWDKNFGFTFSLWDRWFGTLYVPRSDEQFQLGLPVGSGRFDTVWSLLADPFVRAFKRTWRPRPAAGIPR